MMKKFDIALEQSLKYFQKKKGVVGILVGGSYAKRSLAKNSDIDLFVITRNRTFREKGVKIFHGIEVEYFLQPIKQIEWYFKKETGAEKQVTIRNFSEGTILWDPHGVLQQLVRTAKRLKKRKRGKLPKSKIDFMRYSIADTLKDIDDLLEVKNFEHAEVLVQSLFVDLLHYYFAVTRNLFPKNKNVLHHIEDSKTKKFIKNYVTSLDVNKRHHAIVVLSDHIVDTYLGGYLPKEYRIRSKVSY